MTTSTLQHHLARGDRPDTGEKRLYVLAESDVSHKSALQSEQAIAGGVQIGPASERLIERSMDTDWVCKKRVLTEERTREPFNIMKRKPPARATIPAEEKLLVSRGEAAQLLSISQRGLDYLIANRKLPTQRIGAEC
jgi:hypothetical protein